MKRLVLVTLLVSLASSAYGESWVLWTKSEYIDMNLHNDVSWKIENASQDYKQCQENKIMSWVSADKFAASLQDSPGMVQRISSVIGDRVVITYKNPKQTYMSISSFYCLPGTLDPRDKK
jgi:hypothetical protein